MLACLTRSVQALIASKYYDGWEVDGTERMVCFVGTNMANYYDFKEWKKTNILTLEITAINVPMTAAEYKELTNWVHSTYVK